MGKSVSTIVGFGIVTVVFMAIMSMFYLQNVPGKADLERLEGSLRDEFGLYLAAAAPLKLSFLEPEQEGRRIGVEVTCSLRPDLMKRPTTVSLYLDRMAESILSHPDWRGKVDLVTVSHAPPLTLSRTRRTAERPSR